MPTVGTVIEEAVELLLHNNEPTALVDKVELPQASLTVTTGVDGIDLGAAIPEPAALVQPFRVCVTV